jgi:hypothetical protein
LLLVDFGGEQIADDGADFVLALTAVAMISSKAAVMTWS